MKSKIDSSIKITDDQWAVSIVRHGQHAVLLIEKSIYSEYELWRVDLIKKGTDGSEDYYHKNYSFFDTNVYEGEVRKSEMIGAQDKTKSEIYTIFKLTSGCGITWKVNRSLVEAMEDSINDDKDSPPKFHISGKGYNKGGGHSCITWAEEKLNIIGKKLDSTKFSNSVESISLKRITSLHV